MGEGRTSPANSWRGPIGLPEPLRDCPVVQVAYMVPDVREAARRWHTTFGVGPFFVQDHVPLVRATSAGHDVVFDQSCAVTQWGEVMLELVAHHAISPASVAAAIVPRETGLHHIAVLVPDLEASLAHLQDLGLRVVLDAETPQQRFVFVDPGSEAGHLIECYEATPYLQRLYRAVRRAAEYWDGRTLFA